MDYLKNTIMQSSTLSDEEDNKDEGRLDNEGRRL